ncbi:PTS transporter subunit EIIC [Robertmurraya sp.]|jgi:beta-glucoside PTS system EIICBA component|uniref:PTS transporter subunit EIIC n=1 Tax=Robertmurraya sp. TaxID=2837525 RepID=UPI0037038A82
MKYEGLAKEIIEKVGGKENILGLIHCATRLRFTLRDESIADTNGLNNMDDVLSVVQAGGQYQVIIGNHVADVYKVVVKLAGLKLENTVSDENENEKNKSVMNRILDTFIGIMFPLIGIMAATGIIKGFLALGLSVHWLSRDGGTYQLFYTVADCMMYFFPIFVGYTAAKKFKMNEFTGMAIGASLVYPTIATMMSGEPLKVLFKGTIIESPVYTTLFDIPVILMNYSSTIIPAILATYVASKIEKRIKKITPTVIASFGVPMFTLLIIVPFTFLIIGPVAVLLSQAVGSAIVGTYEISPTLVSGLVGALWIPLVIFGLHGAVVPIAFANFFTMGYDVILPMITGHSFAAAGVVVAIALKTKDKKKKGLAISAGISAGIVGVTEPAIYGFLLAQKKLLALVCLISGVGGGLIGYTGTKLFQISGQGVFALPSFIKTDESGMPLGLIVIAIVMLGSFLLATILTYIFYKEKESTTVVSQTSTGIEKN